ncbi:translation initiation factor IF-2-like [Cervus elaphus]|uniref:translation initiation factor IF-2-like n=1 Tax=Cervus elaphus TaxID=9860 RepID=UPI001CC2FE1F|nr:translation initiation factor IF-2-like [Cervus elaphus]
METGHPHWKHPGSRQLRGLRRGRFGPDRHLCSLLILPSKLFRVASPSVNFETLRKSPQERTATTRTAHIRRPPRWPGTLSPPYGVLALSPRSLSVPGFPRPLQRPLQDSPLVKSSPNGSSREAAARSSPEALQDQIALHEAILFCSRYPLPSPFPHPSGSFFGCRPLHHVAVSFRNLVLPPGTPWCETIFRLLWPGAHRREDKAQGTVPRPQTAAAPPAPAPGKWASRGSGLPSECAVRAPEAASGRRGRRRGAPARGRAASPHLRSASAAAAPVRWRSRLSDRSRRCARPGTQSPAGRGRTQPASEGARGRAPAAARRAPGAGGALPRGPRGAGLSVHPFNPPPTRARPRGPTAFPGEKPRGRRGPRGAGRASGSWGPDTSPQIAQARCSRTGRPALRESGLCFAGQQAGAGLVVIGTVR